MTEFIDKMEKTLKSLNRYYKKQPLNMGLTKVAVQLGVDFVPKRLKDRKGRKLEFEDILHYQKIIVALTETDRLMKEIDEVGWK